MKTEESLISKHSSAFSTIIAALIGGGILLYVSFYNSSEPVPSDSSHNTTIIAPESKNKITHTLSAQDVITSLQDKKSTELQISQFTKRNEGTKVQWRVIVKDVRPTIVNSNEHAFTVAFNPAYQKEETLSDVIVASFSKDKENELSSLSEGDFAIIEGILNFHQHFQWYVSLEESSLIKVIKNN